MLCSLHCWLRPLFQSQFLVQMKRPSRAESPNLTWPRLPLNPHEYCHWSIKCERSHSVKLFSIVSDTGPDTWVWNLIYSCYTCGPANVSLEACLIYDNRSIFNIWSPPTMVGRNVIPKCGSDQMVERTTISFCSYRRLFLLNEARIWRIYNLRIVTLNTHTSYLVDNMFYRVNETIFKTAFEMLILIFMHQHKIYNKMIISPELPGLLLIVRNGVKCQVILHILIFCFFSLFFSMHFLYWINFSSFTLFT